MTNLEKIKKEIPNYTFCDISNKIINTDQYDKFLNIAKKNPHIIYTIFETKENKLIFQFFKIIGIFHKNASIMIINKDKYQMLSSTEKLNKYIIYNLIDQDSGLLNCNICMVDKTLLYSLFCCGKSLCEDCFAAIVGSNIMRCPYCNCEGVLNGA
jgi:hypothetical protein